MGLYSRRQRMVSWYTLMNTQSNILVVHMLCHRWLVKASFLIMRFIVYFNSSNVAEALHGCMSFRGSKFLVLSGVSRDILHLRNISKYKLTFPIQFKFFLLLMIIGARIARTRSTF